MMMVRVGGIGRTCVCYARVSSELSHFLSGGGSLEVKS